MIGILQLDRYGFKLRLGNHPARHPNCCGAIFDEFIPGTNDIHETRANFWGRDEREVNKVLILGELQDIVCDP